MSYEDEEDEFNQRNIVMEVKEVPKIYSSLACTNELVELINKMEWKKVMERVSKNHKVRILNNNSNRSMEGEEPLEIECPTRDGDLPLFKCLRNEAPFNVIKIMTDYYPGSLKHSNQKLQNVNALHLASTGLLNLSDDRIKIICFIVNRNFKSLECKNPQVNWNVLHNVIRRNPTLCLVQLIVGLNEGLVKEIDKLGCLPLHHAASTCPETSVLKYLTSVCPQGLITRSANGCLPLHMLMQNNFRSGSVDYFLDMEYLQSMRCYTDEGNLALDYYISVDFFGLKFLNSAQPINPSNVDLRQGLREILEACANGLCLKVGRQKGVSMIKDFITDDVIEMFQLILEVHNFENGLSMMKYLKQIKSGKKIVLMNAEEGQLLLEEHKKAEIKSDEGIVNNSGSNEIIENHIDYVEIAHEEIHVDSDSSSDGECEPAVSRRVS